MLANKDNTIWYPPSDKSIIHFVNQINYCAKSLDIFKDFPVYSEKKQLINSPKGKKSTATPKAVGDVLGDVS